MLEKNCRKFLWNKVNNSRFLSRTSWSRVCPPIGERGVGNKEFKALELSLYGEARSNFLDCIPNPKTSTIWRDILKERDILKKGMIMGVGDGCHISLWYHHWVGECPIYLMLNFKIPNFIAHWRVADIIRQVGCWHIWIMRNKAVFDEKMLHPSSVFNRFYTDYCLTNVTFQTNLAKPLIQSQLALWRPAQPGAYKLNTDGSWKDVAKAAELQALRDGLLLAKRFSSTNIEVETDAKSILIMLDNAEKNPKHDLIALISEGVPDCARKAYDNDLMNVPQSSSAAAT
ncbi:hypothetical protein RDABS01_034387 [Bienertia sinuspersici]